MIIMPKTADGQSVAELSRAFQAELQRIQRSLRYNDSWIRPTGNPPSNPNVLQALFNLAEVAATKANNGGWVRIAARCGFSLGKFKSWEDGLGMRKGGYAPKITDTTSYRIAIAVHGYLDGLLRSDIVERIPESIDILQDARNSVQVKIRAVNEANANYVNELNGIENTLLMVSRSYNSEITILNVALRAVTNELSDTLRPPHMSPESEAALTRLSALRTSVQDSINVLSRPAALALALASAPARVPSWMQALAEYRELAARVERVNEDLSGVIATTNRHVRQLEHFQAELLQKTLDLSNNADDSVESEILALRKDITNLNDLTSSPDSDFQVHIGVLLVQRESLERLERESLSRLDNILEADFRPKVAALAERQMELIVRMNELKALINNILDSRHEIVDLGRFRAQMVSLQTNMQELSEIFRNEEAELPHLNNLYEHTPKGLQLSLDGSINALRSRQDEIRALREQMPKYSDILQHLQSKNNMMRILKNNFFGDSATEIGGRFGAYLLQRNSIYGFFDQFSSINANNRKMYVLELRHLTSEAINNPNIITALLTKIDDGLARFIPRAADSTDSLAYQLTQFRNGLEAAAGVGFSSQSVEKMAEPLRRSP